MSRLRGKHCLILIGTLTFALRGPCDVAGIKPARHHYSELILSAAGLEFRNQSFLGPATYVRVFRKSRRSKPTVNAFFHAVQGLPDDMEMEYTVLQKLSNKWMDTFFTIRKPFCGTLERTNPMEKAFMASTNFPPKCPVTKGNYTITEYVPDVKDFPTVLPYMEIRFRNIWVTGNTVVLKFWIEAKLQQNSKA